MPQIRCPTCGTLINLESRRNNDFNMILKALEKQKRTFSELLKITRLPRKTLSLRLKQLLSNGKIVNDGKFYIQNGKETFADGMFDREIRFPSNKKLIASLIIVFLAIPSIGYVLALISQSVEPQPQPLGYLRAVISVNNVTEVYAWQVAIRFNHTNLKIQSIKPGNFLTEGANIQFNKLGPDMEISDKIFFVQRVLDNGIFIACETLLGKSPGVNGSGTLLVIEFAYFYSYDDESISIMYNESSQYRTILLRKDGTTIPIDQNTISLRLESLK